MMVHSSSNSSHIANHVDRHSLEREMKGWASTIRSMDGLERRGQDPTEGNTGEVDLDHKSDSLDGAVTRRIVVEVRWQPRSDSEARTRVLLGLLFGSDGRTDRPVSQQSPRF